MINFQKKLQEIEKSFRAYEALKKKIKKIVPVQIKDLFFRLVSAELKNKILSTQGSFIYGGRYNPPGAFSVLYLGENIEVCKAESERKVKDFLAYSKVIGKIKVSYKKVLDLTNPTILKKLNIKKDDILCKKKNGKWDLTWKIARIARECEFEAILAPSITGLGNNLIIFNEYLKKEKIKLISKTME